MHKPSENLRIKIALDTQILSYLVDNTYPNLTLFIKELSQNQFVDIICSRFAIYEFIGIRKLEHYLRCLVNETVLKGGKLNFSSAIKYKSEFNTPELKYADTYQSVKEEVEKELSLMYDDFGIVYDNINIHNNLWKPHQDLVLSTRISKEDSLLLLSSIFPDTLYKEDFLVLLTNDKQFHGVFCDDKEIEISNTVFTDNILKKPHIFHLKSIPLSTGRKLNLIDDTISGDEMKTFANQFIVEQIIEKNNKLFLGTIESCPANMQGKLMCFKLVANELLKGIYITVLSEKLEYVYNHKELLENFYNVTQINNYPYIPDAGIDNSRNISIEMKDKEGNYLNDEDYQKLSKNALIFIHPDSSLMI